MGEGGSKARGDLAQRLTGVPSDVQLSFPGGVACRVGLAVSVILIDVLLSVVVVITLLQTSISVVVALVMAVLGLAGPAGAGAAWYQASKRGRSRSDCFLRAATVGLTIGVPCGFVLALYVVFIGLAAAV